MKWYKHLTKMHSDRAIEKLICEFGIAGYGLYCYCLEIIAGSVDSECLTFELEPDAELLARRLGMDTVLIEKIMHRCIEFGLFEIADNGRITCLKLARFLERSTGTGLRTMLKGISDENPEKSAFVQKSPHSSAKGGLEEKRREEKREEREAHGPLKNVFLSQDEYLRLEEDYGDMIVSDYIERLSLWLPNAQKKPKDHNATLRTWLRKDKVTKAYRATPCPHCGGRVVDGECQNVGCPQYA